MLDPDSCWQAVCNRDAQYDGEFVFAVHSTGIYCRPSCPARRPLRRNVSFQRTPAEAEQAGFRPCRRCKPDQPPLAQQHAQKVAAACRLIDSADTLPDLATLAAAVGLSRYHFHRLFKQHTGLTPKAYATAQRAQAVRTALARGTRLCSTSRAVWRTRCPRRNRRLPRARSITFWNYSPISRF